MSDIIARAKETVAGKTPGPWQVAECLEAISEEHWEHRHECQAADQQWYPLTGWIEGEPDRRPWDVKPTRIVRRRVSPMEVVE